MPPDTNTTVHGSFDFQSHAGMEIVELMAVNNVSIAILLRGTDNAHSFKPQSKPSSRNSVESRVSEPLKIYQKAGK